MQLLLTTIAMLILLNYKNLENLQNLYLAIAERDLHINKKLD